MINCLKNWLSIPTCAAQDRDAQYSMGLYLLNTGGTAERGFVDSPKAEAGSHPSYTSYTPLPHPSFHGFAKLEAGLALCTTIPANRDVLRA